jgi:hypothetical protein
MKAKVIIDMPKNCDKCQFIKAHTSWWHGWACQLTGEPIDDAAVKPEWCPLIQIRDDE